MLIFELLDTVHEIFGKNLSYLFTARPYQKPRHHKLVKR